MLFQDLPTHFALALLQPSPPSEPSECDDVIRRAHVSRSRGQQATASISVLEQILGRKGVTELSGTGRLHFDQLLHSIHIFHRFVVRFFAAKVLHGCPRLFVDQRLSAIAGLAYSMTSSACASQHIEPSRTPIFGYH